MVHPGKESNSFMERAVYSHLGSRSRRSVVGPGKGLDNGVVSIDGGRVMILTADPISVIPGFGPKLSAWLSVHLIASDYTASGSDPEFGIFTYNFPEAMRAADRREYVEEIGDECRRLGVNIAGGHTGSYPGGGYTVIGSGTMLGFAPEGGYVTPAMARKGDDVLMTKHAAIEATVTLATSFPAFVDGNVGATEGGRAREMVWTCTTVTDAREARKVGLGAGGVSSMHDATEGGVLGGLEEMAAASNKSFVIDLERIPVANEAEDVCSVFRIDPLTTMGEGSLLITCSPDRVEELRRNLRRSQVPAAVIGRVADGKGLWVRRKRGVPEEFRPGPDAYWKAYELALKRKLK